MNVVSVERKIPRIGDERFSGLIFSRLVIDFHPRHRFKQQQRYYLSIYVLTVKNPPSSMFNRLPYEIFKEIIDISVATISPRLRNRDDPISTDLGVMSLPPITASHVCRSWRDSLLSHPAMWTCLRIPQMRPDALRAMILRSGNALLHVSIEPHSRSPCITAHDVDVLMTIFRSEVHRLRSLQIYDTVDVPGKQWIYLVLPYLKRAAPELQKFCLYTSEGTVTGNRDFLQGLFAGNAPQLSHVFQRLSLSQTLSNCPVFQGLSSLSLELADVATIHWDTLFNILRLSPLLCAFGLNCSRPMPQVNLPTPTNQPIHLPCLRQLWLWGFIKIDLIDLFFRHIVFPLERIEYHIQCFNLPPSQSALLPVFLTQQRPALISICSSIRKMHLDFFQSYPSHDSGIIPPFRTSHTDFVDFPRVLQVFNLSDITHLHAEAGFITTTVFTEIFTLLVNLQFLRLIHGPSNNADIGRSLENIALSTIFSESVSAICTPRFLEALMSEPSTGQTEESGGPTVTSVSIVSPSLRTLEIIVPPYMRLNDKYTQMVYTCSEKRRHAGHPLERITIYCLGSSLIGDAASCLQPSEEFPVDVIISDVSAF